MATDSDTVAEYESFVQRKVIFGAVTVVLLVLGTLYSISIGAVKIPVHEVALTLVGYDMGLSRTILWKIRIPRVLTAIMAGLGLAVSGAVMQKILNNPLGSPFTLGISQAAAFGAAFAIVVIGAGTTGNPGSSGASVGGAVTVNNPYVISTFAFAFSMISAGVILGLAKYTRATPETMILTGVALGSLFSAAISGLQYVANPDDLAGIVFWTFGDVGKTTWTDLGIMTVVALAAAAYFIYNSWNYNVLSSGDETAESLGVDVEGLRMRGMMAASFVTAVVTAFTGIIGFVGLVVPHIVRKTIGGDDRFVIPFSCVVGSVLLLLSDTVARTLFTPIVLPVGILTSFLGAPLFIYLVLRGREYW
jgi:iron complex transport system permease protein